MALISCELVHVEAADVPAGHMGGFLMEGGTQRPVKIFAASAHVYNIPWGGRGFSNPKGKRSSETGKWNFLLSINNGKSPLQRLSVESLGMQQGEDARGETLCPAGDSR